MPTLIYAANPDGYTIPSPSPPGPGIIVPTITGSPGDVTFAFDNGALAGTPGGLGTLGGGEGFEQDIPSSLPGVPGNDPVSIGWLNGPWLAAIQVLDESNTSAGGGTNPNTLQLKLTANLQGGGGGNVVSISDRGAGLNAGGPTFTPPFWLGHTTDATLAWTSGIWYSTPALGVPPDVTIFGLLGWYLVSAVVAITYSAGDHPVPSGGISIRLGGFIFTGSYDVSTPPPPPPSVAPSVAAGPHGQGQVRSKRIVGVRGPSVG